MSKRIISVEHTKSGKNRFIPINKVLIATLLKLKDVDDQSQFVYSYFGNGTPLADVKTSFKAACRRAGINGLRFHDLRHTFATRLKKRGADPITIMELLGHSSLSTTRRYAHDDEGQKRKAVRALEQSALENTGFVHAVSTRTEDEFAAEALSTN